MCQIITKRHCPAATSPFSVPQSVQIFMLKGHPPYSFTASIQYLAITTGLLLGSVQSVTVTVNRAMACKTVRFQFILPIHRYANCGLALDQCKLFSYASAFPFYRTPQGPFLYNVSMLLLLALTPDNSHDAKYAMHMLLQPDKQPDPSNSSCTQARTSWLLESNSLRRRRPSNFNLSLSVRSI